MLSISALKRAQHLTPGGRSLRELLARGERPDRETLIDWGCQLLEILDEAHAHGVRYPQLGETDVAVLPEGRVLILGGGARPASRCRSAAGGLSSPPADLCAVGLLLRRLAFAGALHRAQRRLGARDPLLRVLARATFADPAARYRSAAEMAEALREAGRSGNGAVSRRKDRSAAPGGGVTPFPGNVLRLVPAPAGARPRFAALLGRRARLVLAACLLLAALLAAGWFLLGSAILENKRPEGNALRVSLLHGLQEKSKLKVLTELSSPPQIRPANQRAAPPSGGRSLSPLGFTALRRV